ncbi:transcription factor, contains a PHD finger motif [Rhodotorula kratochvilovae]
MAFEYGHAIDPALLASSDVASPLPSDLIDERALSPSTDAQDRDESEEPRRRPTKRKHSPSAPTPPSRSPAPQPADPSDVSNPPVLVPHTLSLPESAFEFFATRSHPFNKLGYRYTPCGPSHGTPLPVPPQRSIESYPTGIRWSWEDRSSFTLLTEDARTITTDKGWRAARSNIGVREGAWYWEIKVERGGGDGGRDKGGTGQGSWVRVGVGRRESPLNAPVGIDGHSYGYRDKTGDSVTLAQPQPYGQPYGTAHTIGVYLSLPPRPTAPPVDKRDPSRILRKRIPIRYKGQLYFEQLEYAPSKEMDELLVDPALKAFHQRQAEEKRRKAKAAAPGTRAPPAAEDSGPPLRPLPKLEGSRVAFFVDGVCQGVAFEDLYDFLPLRRERPPPGERKRKDPRAMMENHHDDGALGYFPMVSVFGGGIASINPGPEFAFPPPADIEAALAASPHPPSRASPAEKPAWQPLSERYAAAVAEQAYLDDLDEQEAIRVLLETQRDAAAALAASSLAASGESTPVGAAAAKKARTTSLAAAAAVASGKLATLGVVQAGATAVLSESPMGSPRPVGADGGAME